MDPHLLLLHSLVKLQFRAPEINLKSALTVSTLVTEAVVRNTIQNIKLVLETLKTF